MGLGVGESRSLVAVRTLVAAGRVPGMGRHNRVVEADSQDLVDRMRFVEETLGAGVGCIRVGGADSLVVAVVMMEEERVHNFAVEDKESSRETLDKILAGVGYSLVEENLRFSQ